MTSLTIQELNVTEESKPAYDTTKWTSYTRLSSFSKCPQKYNYSYVNKLKENTIEVLEESLLIGRLTHKCLEMHLNGAELKIALELVLPKWLKKDCNLTAVEDDTDEEGYVVCNGIPTRLLVDYAIKIGCIYHRCSQNYLEEDAIRNNDGSVPKDPFNYPPTSVKKEINNLGLYKTSLDINNIATILNPQFRRLKLCDLVAKAAFYLYNFKKPDWVAETLGVEFKFDNLNLEWKRGKNWSGGIDWVFKTVDGAVVICDHKTEKNKLSGLDVMMHPQLNLYAHLYYELTGKLPDYLGIYHLPSGELVMAQVDLNVVEKVVKELEIIEDDIQAAEESNRWRKPLSPAEYDAPCFRRDWKTDALVSVCKYFKHCWSNYAFNIEDELKVFEGNE
jgi:hypothetical protein